MLYILKLRSDEGADIALLRVPALLADRSGALRTFGELMLIAGAYETFL
jgi:hypothetical protein